MDDVTQDLINDVSTLNDKMDYIVKFLDSNYEENKDDKIKKKKMYDLVEEKEQKETLQNTRFSAFKRKERQYQAIPFVFDGVTNEGKKQLNKALKNMIGADVPGIKKAGGIGGLLGDLLAAAGFGLGLLLGVFAFITERVKFLYELAKEAFTAVENFFKDIKEFFLPTKDKLKFDELLKDMEEVFKLSPEMKEKIRANKEKFFKDLEEMLKIDPKSLEFKSLNDPKILKDLDEIAKMYGMRVADLKTILQGEKDFIDQLKMLNATHQELVPNLKIMLERIKQLPPEILKLSPKELDQYIIELQAANDETKLKFLNDLRILRKFRLTLQAPTFSEAEMLELRGYIKKFEYETLKMSLEDLTKIIEKLKDSGSADSTFVKALEELKRLKIEGYTLEELRNLKTDIELFNIEIAKRKTLFDLFVRDLKELATAITPDFILEMPNNMKAYLDGLRAEIRISVDDFKAAFKSWGDSTKNFFSEIKKDLLGSMFTEQEIVAMGTKITEYKQALKGDIISMLDKVTNMLGVAKPGELAASESVTSAIGNFIGTVFVKLGDLIKTVMEIPAVKAGIGIADKFLKIFGVLFAAIDDILPLALKAIKGEDIPKEMLVTNLTHFVLQLLGWLGGAAFFPLIFLDKQSIEPQIKKWLNSQDGTEFYGRLFSSVGDVAYKAMISLMDELLIQLPGKLVAWVVGLFDKGAGEKINTYVEGAKEGVNEHLREFTFYDLGDKIITGLLSFVDMALDALRKLLTPEWWLAQAKKKLADAQPVPESVEKAGAGIPAGGSEQPPGPVAGDLIDDGERMLIAGKDRVTFRKDDEILAIRKGGPVDKIFTAAFNTQTNELKSSFEGMSTAVAREMSKNTTRLEALVNYIKLQNEYLASISRSNQSIAETPTQAVNLVNQSVKNNVNIDAFTSTTYRSKLGRAPLMMS